MDAVVFDCDGVLVNSEAPLVAIDQRMLADLGWEMTLEEVHTRFVGMSADAYLAEVRRHVPRLPENWREPYLPLIEKALHDDLEMIPGVEDAIRSVEVPIAVASNSSRRRVHKSLEFVGLLKYFGDRVVSAEDVPKGKPAPDVYLEAARILGVGPEKCVAIEDSPTGVRAARAAGMTVLGYANGLTSKDALRGAGATTFTDMSDLPGLLGNLASPQ
jgi:HAD superfamily hydrolase (TIGR01509 family)